MNGAAIKGDIVASAVLQRYAVVIEEHGEVLKSIDPVEVDALAAAVLKARRVFLSGQGRSGNMVRALAIRFMHIGVKVHVAGEPTTPAVDAGDLLLAVSASAKTKATLEHIEVARKVGAAVALITTVSQAPGNADVVLRIPVRQGVPTVQHAGSLFEQAILLLGDSLAWHVQKQLGVDDAALDARHANLQ